LSGFDGSVVHRDGAGYEAARRAAVANGRVPDRRPATIVRARTADDVVAAIALARREGRGVTVRSGGHSWSGAHLADDVVLIDLSELTSLQIDREAMTAVAGPGLRSSELAAALAPLDLFFPTGHCTGPGLGGYLLQGGFGWNSRVLGPACMSVEAIDVVTADGRLVHAGADENEDLYWAARGAGPLFFGAVLRYHLRLAPRPAACLLSVDVYPIELLEEVMRWLHATGPEVPRTMELMAFIRRDVFGHAGPVVMVAGPTLADSEEQARADLALLETCPVRDRALPSPAPQYAATDVMSLVAENEELYPTGWRYAADNMWTHAPIDELLPGLRRIAETLPSAPSHLMWMNWGEPRPERPDMAFSSEDHIYMAVYGISQDAARDDADVIWVTDRMREMEHLSSGIQLADENLARRPARFMAPDRLARLREIRARRDPDRLFLSSLWPD
jgi:FAD/FMN-containing dehydrogenase